MHSAVSAAPASRFDVSSFEYSRARFLRALCILRGDEALPGVLDSPKKRLQLALLVVYPCAPHHFARRLDYARFAALMARVRDHSPIWKFTDAITRMSASDCAHLIEELTALAMAVIHHFALVPLPPDVEGRSPVEGERA